MKKYASGYTNALIFIVGTVGVNDKLKPRISTYTKADGTKGRVANFQLSTVRRGNPKVGNPVDEYTNFRCTVWGRDADIIGALKEKFNRVTVHGEIYQETYTNQNGEQVKGWKVEGKLMSAPTNILFSKVAPAQATENTPTTKPVEQKTGQENAEAHAKNNADLGETIDVKEDVADTFATTEDSPF